MPFTSITDRQTDGLESRLNKIAERLLTQSKSSIKIAGEGEHMPASTLEFKKTAASPAPSAPMTVEDARAMIQNVQKAEADGIEMNDENMRALGFIETEGGTIELPIPVHILRQL